MCGFPEMAMLLFSWFDAKSKAKKGSDTFIRMKKVGYS